MNVDPQSAQDGFNVTTGDQDVPPESRPSLAALISQAISQVQKLIKDEIALIKMKLSKAMQKMAGGAAMLVLAALFALLLLFWVFHTIEMAIAVALPAWAAALITLGILLLLVIIFAAIGVMLLKKGSEDLPDVGATVKSDIDAIKEGLNKNE